MIKKLCSTALLLNVLSFPMQAQDLSQRLSQAMQQKQLGAYFNGVTPFMNDMAASPGEFVALLQAYGQDSLASVRDFTCELYAAIYEKTDSYPVKQTAVERLCAALSDSVRRVRSTAASALEGIPKDVFTGNAQQLIAASFSACGELDEEQVLLVGYLGRQELADTLQQLKNDPAQENRVRWCCYLALARMGDGEALDFVLAATQRQGVNDRTVYNYFPDLVYTRQRKAFNYLIRELHSSDKNCHSPNPNVDREMVCGYRIMEMLAPAVKDFPLKTRFSGSIDAKNYDKALDTVRKWFKQHETDYVISDTAF